MAILKQIKTEYGINAEYWKITSLSISKLSRKSTNVVISGWVSRDSFIANDKPIANYTFDWSNGEFPFIDTEPQNEYQVAYLKIKLTDEFIGSEDIDL